MPIDYSGYPGCFILIRVQVMKDASGVDQLTPLLSTVSYATDETTPVISTYSYEDDIILPSSISRPFGFALQYDIGGDNPLLPDGAAKYTWADSLLDNLKIWPDGDPEPGWGSPLPADFQWPKQQGGEITFVDSNGSDGGVYNYCVRLWERGSNPPVYLTLDPKIKNSGNTNR